jgi:hypothetical protein
MMEISSADVVFDDIAGRLHHASALFSYPSRLTHQAVNKIRQ